jgi:anti-anti-sigma factor
VSLENDANVEQDPSPLAQTESVQSSLLDITVSHMEDTALMVLAGEVDMSSVPILQREFEKIAADVTSDLVIDLGLVTFLDSMGISFLVTAHQRLEDQGARLMIFSPNQQVRRLFELTGLTSLLLVAPEASEESSA